MQNSKNATVATKNNATKSATKKTSQKVEQTKENLKNVKDEDIIYEILDREKQIEEAQAQLENLELENATLRANAKHSNSSVISKELKEAKKQIEKLEFESLEITLLQGLLDKQKETFAEEQKRRQAAEQLAAETKTNAEILKKELEKAQKPTHATAEEKLNRLKKANDISLMLERRKQLFNEFQKATTGDEQEQFKIIFISSNGSEFELAKSEIVKALTDLTSSYMQNTISETEQELLSYQI